MTLSFIIGLLQNISILLVFAILYSNFWLKDNKPVTLFSKIVSGIIIGLIGLLIMHTSWEFTDGITFDARTILLATSGLFFGTIPTLIGLTIIFFARILIGGGGLIMGVVIIILSGLLGIFWRNFRKRQLKTNPYIEFFYLSTLLHFLMLASGAFLPQEIKYYTMSILVFPILLLYIPGTFLLLALLHKQQINFENKTAKEKLLNTERSLSNILKGGNFIAIILDSKGIIKFCNEYLMNLTGYKKEELIGNDIFDKLITKDTDFIRFKQYFSNLPDNSNFDSGFESLIYSKDNDEFFISWHATANYDEYNTLAGVTAIGINITDRVNYEKELERVNLIVKEKNKQYRLLNEELTIATKKATESDKLKTAFLTNLSHELRTPMNGILGFLQLLQDKNLEEDEIVEYSSIINRSSDRMLKTINDIIEISKIQTEYVPPKYDTVMIYDDLKNLHSDYLNIANKKNIDLIFKVDDKLKSLNILTDKTMLISSIDHLLNNAIKFTSEGKVEFGYLNGSDRLTFYIKDTGIGIPSDKQNTIFDIFVQADDSPTRRFEGVGLGLSLVKAYVNNLGGELEVLSEVNKGSTFSFSIPFYTPNDE